MSWYRISNNNLGLFSNYNSLPKSANGGDLATIPQLVGSERIKMEYNAVLGLWVVAVGSTTINAHDYFTVDPVTSTSSVILDFPGDSSLIRPNQIWECNSHATAVLAGAVSSGYRTQFGGATTNSAKAIFSQAVPRSYERKLISRRASGSCDTMAVGIGAGAGVDELYTPYLPIRIAFEPGQIGDSMILRHYSLRRIG